MATVVFLEIIFGSGEMYDKMDALMLMICAILSILKLFYFRYKADNLIRNFKSAVTDYLAIDSEEKRTIMRRHAFMGRMILYSIISFTYFTSSVYLLAPMIAGDKDIQVNVSIKSQAANLPVPLTWSLRNFDISTNVFLLISGVQYFLFVLNSTTDCGNKLIVNTEETCTTKY